MLDRAMDASGQRVLVGVREGTMDEDRHQQREGVRGAGARRDIVRPHESEHVQIACSPIRTGWICVAPMRRGTSRSARASTSVSERRSPRLAMRVALPLLVDTLPD
jgi:hypothetical protein